MEYVGMTIKNWFLEDPSLKPQLYASECFTAMALNPPPNFQQEVCRKAKKTRSLKSLNDTQRSKKRVHEISEVSSASVSVSFSFLDSCPCTISSIIKQCGNAEHTCNQHEKVSALLIYICHWYRFVVHILRKDHALRPVRSSEGVLWVFAFKLLQPRMWNAGDSWEGFGEECFNTTRVCAVRSI